MIPANLIFLSFVVGRENIVDAHDSSVLVSSFCAYVENCHGELVVKIAETKFSPYIFLSWVTSIIPSMGFTSNSWHISLNLSLNLGSDLISFLYFLANSLRLL